MLQMYMQFWCLYIVDKWKSQDILVKYLLLFKYSQSISISSDMTIWID